jgi:hypothetical protein
MSAFIMHGILATLIDSFFLADERLKAKRITVR